MLWGMVTRYEEKLLPSVDEFAPVEFILDIFEVRRLGLDG